MLPKKRDRLTGHSLKETREIPDKRTFPFLLPRIKADCQVLFAQIKAVHKFLLMMVPKFLFAKIKGVHRFQLETIKVLQPLSRHKINLLRRRSRMLLEPFREPS